jgi:hypothetical protein
MVTDHQMTDGSGEGHSLVWCGFSL